MIESREFGVGCDCYRLRESLKWSWPVLCLLCRCRGQEKSGLEILIPMSRGINSINKIYHLYLPCTCFVTFAPESGFHCHSWKYKKNPVRARFQNCQALITPSVVPEQADWCLPEVCYREWISDHNHHNPTESDHVLKHFMGDPGAS